MRRPSVSWAAVLVLATAAGSGCERPAPQPDPAAATTAPAADAPFDPRPVPTTAPSTPASSQPATSVMNIGGLTTIFPPARLRLETDGRHLVALLFSDDPRDALKDNYTGNSFYLRMELDVDDPEKLAEATWRYAAPSASDREDSPYGIYLGGRKVQLVPFQVMGQFKVDPLTTVATTAGTTAPAAGKTTGAETTTGAGTGATSGATIGAATSVLISGQFQIVDDAARRGPAQIIAVAAELPVRVDADTPPREKP